MMLLASIAAWKLGWAKLHVPASERPLTVNRSSTPPLGALVFTEPFELKKNGNRASRVGPVAVMNDGVVSLGATPPGERELRIGSGAAAANRGLCMAGNARN